MTHLLILLVSLAVLVILVRFKVELGLALLAAALVLGASAGLGPARIVTGVWAWWSSATTLDLLGSLLSILAFENILRRQGYLQRVLASLRVLFADYRIPMALCPAFLGLLPSAGGAVLSAPMVQEAAADRPITGAQKSVVNYWYRHIWEYSLPLYPGVILAAKTVDVPLASLIVRLFPFTLLAVLLGLPVALRTLPAGETAAKASPAERRRGLRQLVLGTAPVLLVILAVAAAGVEVWAAVLLTSAGLLVLHRYGPGDLWRLLKEALSGRTTLLVAGIMAFRGMLEAAGMVRALPGLITRIGLPPVAVVISFPLIMGALIGLSQGFVGASFPLLLGIIGTGPQARLGLVVLAFVAGFTGVMITPLHFCLVLTVQYFRADL
ncbi:MAG: DUF401 family protein, partial [Bacteroidota bacterium]